MLAILSLLQSKPIKIELFQPTALEMSKNRPTLINLNNLNFSLIKKIQVYMNQILQAIQKVEVQAEVTNNKNHLNSIKLKNP